MVALTVTKLLPFMNISDAFRLVVEHFRLSNTFDLLAEKVFNYYTFGVVIYFHFIILSVQ